MKKSVIFFALLLTAFQVFSQGDPHLKIKRCSKKLADRSLAVDSVEQVRLTSHDLRKGKVKFTYRDAAGDAEVKRTFMVEDKDGKQVYSAEGSSFTIRSKELRELLKVSPLKVYTMAIPSDPEKAKIVRVRRIQVAEFLFTM